MQIDQVTKNCQEQKAKIETWLQAEEKFFQGHAPSVKAVYFFLGPFKGNRWPELLMVNDGPVAFWTKAGKLKTFTTDLAYVRWGEKWKKGLIGNYLLLGLDANPVNEGFSVETVGPHVVNVHDPGILSPGLWQIQAMRRMVEAKLW